MENDGLIEILKDLLGTSAKPENRVMRKVALLFVTLTVSIITYGHIIRGFTHYSKFLVTAYFILMLFVGCLFGGIICTSMYGWLLRKVGAYDMPPSYRRHFFEWLAALSTPFGALVFLFFASGLENFAR